MEQSAGGIIFYRTAKGEPLFLLMINRKGYLEFPKGHLQRGETDLMAAKREVNEETGLSQIKVLQGFKTMINYRFQRIGRETEKQVVFFLMETRPQNVVISEEHQGFMWLPYEEAMSKLSYNNARNVLSEGYAFLNGLRGLWRQ
ncbi:MAG: NUDIX domain-containing protein [Conexivisphaerales archaeon]|jgi:8-oxo-dGTP pyrophosphatase MutT (NUDIX family)